MSLNIHYVNDIIINKIIHKNNSSRTEIIIKSRDLGNFQLTLYSEKELIIKPNISDFR